jgi:nicotinamide-nucleotide amidase
MKTDLELISIGTELLSGRTLNSHAQTLGAALTRIGLRLVRDTTIPDEIETIQLAVRDALDRVDIVIVSGGLGPTSDDITRDALAGLFRCKTVPSPEGLAALHARFAARGLHVSPVSERMALILEGAAPLINHAGAAVAQRLDFPELGKSLFIVPGPPNEFAAVLEDHIVPWLIQNFPDVIPLELRVLITEGIGESKIVEWLEAKNVQCSDVAIGFYPGAGKVEIRLTAPKEKTAALDALTDLLRTMLCKYLIA